MEPEYNKNSNETSTGMGTEDKTIEASNGSDVKNEPPKKNNKWKIIIITIFLIIVIIPVIGYILIAISLSGGIDGVISGLKRAPNPESSSIVSKRNTATETINGSFKELDSQIGFDDYGISTHDRCYEGQNNFKVKDGYAHRCTYRITKFYGFSGDFRQKMIDFEQRLISSGWNPAYDSAPPLTQIMEEYYDEYYNKEESPVNLDLGGRYLVSNLPTPSSGYLKETGILEIEYAEKATKDLSQIEYAQNVSRDTLFDTYDKQDFQDTESVFKKITQNNNYVLVISIQEDYFQN